MKFGLVILYDVTNKMVIKNFKMAAFHIMTFLPNSNKVTSFSIFRKVLKTYKMNR